MTRIKVTWHGAWNADLESALNVLPEPDLCPRELYRELLTARSDARIALASDSAGPVALIGLRKARTGGAFEPITNWLIPGPNFPVRPGMAQRALSALRVRVAEAWWRMPEPPRQMRGHAIEAVQTFGMRTDDDWEAFWGKSSALRNLRRSRKRCEKFRVVINPPRGAEWVTRNWDQRWRGEGESPSLAYRLIIANYLERIEKHTTIALFDGHEMIGGATQIIQGDTAVAGVLHYLPEYRAAGVGHRLIDLHFQHARETGLRVIDIGGGHDYKLRWAPVLGERFTVKVWPPMLRPARAAVGVVKSLRARMGGSHGVAGRHR